MVRLRRDGVLVVDKPAGPTSHDLVSRARRIFDTRAVGHAGTLDPLATGVLLLLIGEATKLAPFLSIDQKRYLTRIAFGSATDTLDAGGVEVARAEVPPGAITLPALESALANERLRELQVPPNVSAIKVAGERAHRLHRRGQTVDLPPRAVAVHEARLVSFTECSATIDLTVSKGYYVRSLARDLGTSIGLPAHVANLRRLASGAYSIAEAVAWPPDADAPLVSLSQAIAPALEVARLTERGEDRARKGQRLAPDDFVGKPPRRDPSAWLGQWGALIAIGARADSGGFRVTRGFRPPG